MFVCVSCGQAQRLRWKGIIRLLRDGKELLRDLFRTRLSFRKGTADGHGWTAWPHPSCLASGRSAPLPLPRVTSRPDLWNLQTWSGQEVPKLRSSKTPAFWSPRRTSWHYLPERAALAKLTCLPGAEASPLEALRAGPMTTTEPQMAASRL